MLSPLLIALSSLTLSATCWLPQSSTSSIVPADRIVMMQAEPVEGGPTGYLGVAPGSAEKDKGIAIDRVIEGSPASKAGLKVGDRILKVGEHATPDSAALIKAVRSYHVGEMVAIELLRDGMKMRLFATLGGQPVPVLSEVPIVARMIPQEAGLAGPTAPKAGEEPNAPRRLRVRGAVPAQQAPKAQAEDRDLAELLETIDVPEGMDKDIEVSIAVMGPDGKVHTRSLRRGSLWSKGEGRSKTKQAAPAPRRAAAPSSCECQCQCRAQGAEAPRRVVMSRRAMGPRGPMQVHRGNRGMQRMRGMGRMGGQADEIAELRAELQALRQELRRMRAAQSSR
ncbi:MAG: PDZ domain-containing protein [Planctomycetota bacterium]